MHVAWVGEERRRWPVVKYRLEEVDLLCMRLENGVRQARLLSFDEHLVQRVALNELLDFIQSELLGVGRQLLGLLHCEFKIVDHLLSYLFCLVATNLVVELACAAFDSLHLLNLLHALLTDQTDCHVRADAVLGPVPACFIRDGLFGLA